MSYYINLVLEGVGITKPETKAAINGGLQVSSFSYSFSARRVTLLCQLFNFTIAIGSASLIDWVGRRTLFIISNSGMLAGRVVVLDFSGCLA